MDYPKNIQNYVVNRVINYLNSDDKILLGKIKSGAILREFVQNVDVNEFEDAAHFYKYAFAVHKDHTCPIHKITYSYDDNNNNDVEWHSSVIEYKLASLITSNVSFVYPCCVENDSEDAEEDE